MCIETLKAKQLEEYPNSVFLEVHAVYKWCDEAESNDKKLSRYMQISMALQYPEFIFYRIEGTAFRGVRYGINDGEYMSFYTA